METAHKTEKEKKEHFDSPDELNAKCQKLASMISSCKMGMFFTGAGISTSCGIPDFRSGVNTVLQTGPGLWEKKKQNVSNNNKQNVSNNNKQNVSNNNKKRVVDTAKAMASPTHMAIKQLIQEGQMHCLVSQNVDGLHRKTGVDIHKMVELHGNTNLEKCKKCNKYYMRDFRTRTAKNVHDHKTTRKCDNPNCKGDLYDSIINFGENLDEKVLNQGFQWSEQADLCIVLGSSLRVTPAANIPEQVANRGQPLVIVNLQSTPLDSIATLRINGLIDDVMQRVMGYLGIVIPPFKLYRYFTLQQLPERDKSRVQIQLRSVDSNEDPFSLFKQVVLHTQTKCNNLQSTTSQQVFKQEPFNYITSVDIKGLAIRLTFQQHYREPDFQTFIDFNRFCGLQKQVFKIEYDFNGNWTLYHKNKDNTFTLMQ